MYPICVNVELYISLKFVVNSSIVPLFGDLRVKTSVEKLESVQKRGFKWVLKTYTGFSSKVYYYHTCKQLDILPISIRFDLKDLTYFHSIFYGLSEVKFPDYLSHFQGSKLRRCHLDNLCIKSSIHPKVPQNLDSEILYSGIGNLSFIEPT